MLIYLGAGPAMEAGGFPHSLHIAVWVALFSVGPFNTKRFISNARTHAHVHARTLAHRTNTQGGIKMQMCFIAF